MDGISIPNTRLPPGFRFHPTDQELIIYYLKNKVSPSPTPVVSMMADIDLYKFNPWELPGKAFFGESEWFFFSPRDRKYPNGARPNRAAASGYWKATGTDKPILASGGSQCLGVKKALVFYIGRPPKGMKTNWMMLEYRLLDDAPRSTRIKGSMRLDDWVLCRVRQKSNNPSQIDEQHESLFSSPPYNHRNMEDQAIMKRNDLLEPSDCHFLATRTGSQEGGAVEGCGSISSQRTSKVPIQDMGPQSQALQDMLESIKRTLSIGALDEEQESVPPTKRLNTSTSDNLDGTDMKEGSFHVGSSSNPYAFRGP